MRFILEVVSVSNPVSPLRQFLRKENEGEMVATLSWPTYFDTWDEAERAISECPTANPDLKVVSVTNV